MGNPVIKVEQLGKKYLIGHQQKPQNQTFGELITDSIKQFWRKGKEQRTDDNRVEEFWAVRDLNFEIKQGDRVGIIGRNGAGKSTLLKILSRITDPSEGRIKINGRVASLLEVGTGFHPDLTGRENVFLNGAILGMSRAEIRSKFDEIVAFAEVEKFLDTPVKRYSSGMYVRLAFAVAAHLEPEILIVDEVLAVGDAQFQKKCLGKMEDVSKNEGRTVLFVSHNMGVVSQLCQSAILLKKGKLLAFDSTQKIIQSYITSDQDKDNIYVASNDMELKKPNYFTKIFSENTLGHKTSDYSFDESIILNFEFVIRQSPPNLQIGIGLNDKFQNRVFTIIKPIDFFKPLGNNKYSARVKLPVKIIAPNFYSFAFAIWTKEGNIFDFIDNVCPVKVYDSGTHLAMYEGLDIGCVIVHADWENEA